MFCVALIPALCVPHPGRPSSWAPLIFGKVCLSFPRTQGSLWGLLHPDSHSMAASLLRFTLAWTLGPPRDVT